MSRFQLKLAESRAIRILLRVAAAECVAVAGVLAYAVVHAAASTHRSSRMGVVIGYVVAAIALAALATLFWWLAGRRRGGGPVPRFDWIRGGIAVATCAGVA